MQGKKLFVLVSGGLVLLLLVLENLSVRSKFKIALPESPIKTIRIFTGQRADEDDDDLESPQSPEEMRRIFETEEGLFDSTPAPVGGDEEGKGKKPKRIRVCTIALNPRQGSLFRTNLLGEYGSGKYRYVVKSDCAWNDRRVRLISYVKCCESLFKVTRSVNLAVSEFDVVIVTGDEYCSVTDARAQFRQYYGTQIISTAKNITVVEGYQPSPELMDAEGIRFPLYIPLGPREEFLQVRINKETDIVPTNKRQYLYNFLGSMTSWSRQVLKRVVARDLATPENQERYPAFVHITDKWHIKVTKNNGYVEPDEYKRVLLNSIFTLCPTGHNPEAYRIFEALEAGSIPILAIDPWYDKAKCNDAFRPYREANAPFIYLQGGWKQLESFLERRGKNATWVAERQKACLDWYKSWMTKVALRFEAIMEHRYNKRMLRGEDASLERDEQESERDEAKAIAEEENHEDDDDLGSNDQGEEDDTNAAATADVDN